MKTTPRLQWYLVVVFAPHLSPRRLLWAHEELSRGLVSPRPVQWLLERAYNRHCRHTAAWIPSAANIGDLAEFPHDFS